MAYKKILIAVDASAEAVDVLRQAAELIDLYQAEAEVLHVAPSLNVAYGAWGAYMPALDEDQIHAELIERLEERMEIAEMPSVPTHVLFGQAVDTVINKANADEVDLIVLGSHGRHGVRLVLGSTANGILHHACCDVLAVRIRETIEA